MAQVVFEDNVVFLVMELVTGASCYDLVASGEPVAEDRARYMFKQMVSAMDYCHNRKIYHRVRWRPRPCPRRRGAAPGCAVCKSREAPGDHSHFVPATRPRAELCVAPGRTHRTGFGWN